MKYFLELVADSLRRKWGNNLSRVAVVFPNKRAGLFLNDYLLPKGDTTLWAPRYLTVSEWIRSVSSLRLADPIDTVCRLYRHYVKLTGSDETLDHFYGWGERLLADFDDVDKNMANAKSLFRSLNEYESITADEFLTDEQIMQLNRFVKDFNKDSRSLVRERYLKLWNSLYALYELLRGELAAEHLAYEGQLYRDVAEKALDGELPLPKGIEHLAFVGFNVIDRVEHTLFKSLQASGKASFYWDYDRYYVRREGAATEAGIFLQRNLRDFPNELDDADCFDNFMKSRETRSIRFASAATDTAQAYSVAEWLSQPENFNPGQARRTAIVLCNETLLQPVLHALPAHVRDVNVTKGFPLGHTSAFALVSQLTAQRLDELAQEQKESGNADHASPPASAASLSAELDALQQAVKEKAAESEQKENDPALKDLYAESFFQVYTILARFKSLVENGRLSVRLSTLFRLVCQVMRQTSVPFHGEPASGLQIMGLLETRCLDFDHVLILSAEEGTLPQRAADASFIPFPLRVKFGLTTPLHKTSVSAYYFHRLLQRARTVQIAYNASTEGTHRGEMSRFMRALLVESGLNIESLALTSVPRPITLVTNSIAKPAQLASQFTRLSPSAINAYLKCQLSFYFKYVLRLKAPEPKAAIIQDNDFGSLFHASAEAFYKPWIGKPVTGSMLTKRLKDTPQVLSECVRGAYDQVNKESQKELRPTPIVDRALLEYLQRLLRFDAASASTPEGSPIVIRELEARHYATLRVPLPKGELTLKVGGIIDRMDEMKFADGLTHIRIIDYKTGGNPETHAKWDNLFKPASGKNEKQEHPHYTLQTLIYAQALTEEGLVKQPVTPALFFLKGISQKDYSSCVVLDKEKVLDFGTVAERFKEGLTGLLSEIFDTRYPFVRPLFDTPCKSCDFRKLCGR